MALLCLGLLYELVAFGDHEVPLAISTLARSARDPSALIIESTDLSSRARSSCYSRSATSALGFELAAGEHSLLEVVAKGSFPLVLRLGEARVEVLLIVIELSLHPYKGVREGIRSLCQEVARARRVALGLEYLLALHIRVASGWTIGHFQ